MTAVDVELVAVAGPRLRRAGWGLAPARGAYYRPSGRRPQVAFIAAHYNLDFSQHYLAQPLAAHGYGFLGWNTRYCGREPYFLLDRALVDLGLGVRWLRERGASAVVLLGNSGGGSLLAAYHAQSQAPVVRPPHGLRLAAGIDELPAAELYISLVAHPGRPQVFTNWLDPAVLDESDPLATDPELDMYDLANGPPYGAEFIDRYRVAQRARNERITDWCRRELDRLEAGGHPDRLFTVHRTWADLRFLDAAIDPSDRPVPGCYLGDPQLANKGIEGIGTVSSLRTWLSMWSLQRSQCNADEYLSLIDVPTLVIQARADTGVFPSDALAIFDALATSDKQLVELQGDHYFLEPPQAREELASLLASWVRERVGEP